MKKETKICILCRNTFDGYGHNPEPLAPSYFSCCELCNDTKVIPYRLELINL